MKLYPRATDFAILPLDFVVRGHALDRQRSFGAPVVIGILGNLTVDKGIERAFDTLDEVLACGLDARLLVAGPLMERESVAILERRLRLASGRATYLGPVHEGEKSRFFEAIDFFVFPTRYPHESFGLVVAEALSAGVPVIAYEAGCLSAERMGLTTLILDPAGAFAPSAARQIAEWWHQPESYRNACDTAKRQAAVRQALAQSAAKELASSIARTCA